MDLTRTSVCNLPGTRVHVLSVSVCTSVCLSPRVSSLPVAVCVYVLSPSVYLPVCLSGSSFQSLTRVFGEDCSLDHSPLCGRREGRPRVWEAWGDEGVASVLVEDSWLRCHLTASFSERGREVRRWVVRGARWGQDRGPVGMGHVGPRRPGRRPGASTLL